MGRLFTIGLVIVAVIATAVAVVIVFRIANSANQPMPMIVHTPTATPAQVAAPTSTPAPAPAPTPLPINLYGNGDIVGSRDDTCVLDSRKSIRCWGEDDYGELRDVPSGQFTAIASGANHFCAINTNSSVECWGSNEFGESTPPEGRFESISLADYYSCGIMEGGTVSCWGDQFIAEEVPEGRFESIAAGGFHVCALDFEGYTTCWGKNFAGQTNTPEEQFSSLSSGTDHVCGIRLDGTVKCWGSNDSGQASPPIGAFVLLGSGPSRTCGITESSAVLCWGSDEYGQSSPTAGLVAKDLGLGWFHTCALLVNGFTKCWGDNQHGQFPPLDFVQNIQSPQPSADSTPTPVPQPNQPPIIEPTETPTTPPDAVPTPREGETLTVTDVVKMVKDSVVRISTSGATGSGWIYRTEGRRAWILTNQHVVENDPSPSIFIEALNRSYNGEVLGFDVTKDLAVVTVCCSSNFSTAMLGDSQSLDLGQEVLALGYPLGATSIRVARGIVASEELYESRNARYIRQTDAAINPGNSGGPLVDLNARVVGINTTKVDYSASGRPVEGTGYAVTEQTISQTISQLESGQRGFSSITPPPSILPPPGFRPPPNARNFGPEDGEIPHNPGDRFIESFEADVNVSNFYASATIINPYSASTGGWDFCIAFRDQNTKNGDFQYFVVESNERYSHNARENGRDTLIESGTVPNLNLGRADENEIVLIAIEGEGWLFIDKVFVTSLDLTDNVASGDVWLGTGCTEGNERSRSTTRFEDFLVGVLTDDSVNPDGELIATEGFISTDYAGLSQSAAYLKARFVNPLASQWSYGFVFRENESEVFYSVVIDDDEFWQVNDRDGSASDEVIIAEGSEPNIKTITGDTNELAVLYIGRFGALYINNKLVGTFTMDRSTEGDMGIAGWFFESDTPDEPILYRDFEVWLID